jgi:hypothetical protein
VLAPLDTLPVGVPEKTLGWGVLRWALTRFIQPDGPNAGKPFRPTMRQVRVLLWWYALDDNGEFIYRHGVRRLAKGSGKARAPLSCRSASSWALSGSRTGMIPLKAAR